MNDTPMPYHETIFPAHDLLKVVNFKAVERDGDLITYEVSIPVVGVVGTVEQRETESHRMNGRIRYNFRHTTQWIARVSGSLFRLHGVRDNTRKDATLALLRSFLST